MTTENLTQDQTEQFLADNSIFHDSKGRPWNLRVTFGAAMALRDQFDLDVATLFTSRQDSTLQKLVEDPWKLIEIIGFLTADARKALSVSDEDFLSSLDGLVLDNATRAFLYGLTGSLGKYQRRVLLSLLARMDTVQDATIEKVTAILDRKISEAAEKINSRIGDLDSAPLEL